MFNQFCETIALQPVTSGLIVQVHAIEIVVHKKPRSHPTARIRVVAA